MSPGELNQGELNQGDANLLRLEPQPIQGSQRAARDAWQRVGAAIAILLTTFIVLWPTTETLLVKWSDSVLRTYTHGLAIIGISCFLLWRLRAQLAQQPVRHSWLGFAAMAVLGVCWLIGYRSGVQILHQALLPLLVGAALWTAFGAVFLRRALLPIAYLYFAIPVWDTINPLLQWISAGAVRVLLRGVGIPAYFDGLQFQIPAGTFEIAGGCSGLHFLIVALAIAVLYGEINRDTVWTRVKLVVLAGVLAMVTNWLRIAIIIVAGHLTQMQHYLVRGEHYSFGWVMFAIALGIFFLIVRRWPIVETQAGHAPACSDTSFALSATGLALAAAALGVLALWPRLDANVAEPALMQAHLLPEAVDGWQVSDEVTSWSPVFERVDEQQLRRFQRGGQSIEAYSGIYLQQYQGKELAGYTNRPYGQGATVTSRVGVPGGHWTQARVRDSTGSSWILWSVYRIGDRWYSKPLQAQLAYGVASLFAAPASSVLILRAGCAEDCDVARQSLESFVTTAGLAVTRDGMRS